MNATAIRRLLRLYPRAWRDRYEEEFAALLEQQPATLGAYADIVLSAIVARLRALVGASVTGVRHDFHYVLRGLRSRPGFASAVIEMLALGMGANAAMFGIIDRLLFRAPEYLIAPERATRVYTVQRTRGSDEWNSTFGYRRYLDFRETTRAFDALTPFDWTDQAVGDGEGTHLVKAASSGEDLWKMFAVRPVIGRFFDAAENDPLHPAFVAVLSYGFWQTEYGGRADVLGQKMHIGMSQYAIIGVTPPGFTGFADEPISLFLPMSTVQSVNWSSTTWSQTYNSAWFTLFARRKANVSLDQATADLSEAFRRSYAKELASTIGRAPIDVARPRALAASVRAERGPRPSSESRVATWLAGVALIVLLIACVNVTNLLIGRSLSRRREIALRLALGVSRGRLARQLFIETFVLALLGGIGGFVMAIVGGPSIAGLLLGGPGTPFKWFDWRVATYTGALVLLVALLSGIAPALQARRTDVASAMRGGARDGVAHRSRLRASLLVIQAALSVVLLVGAGLFVRSLTNVQRVRIGFDVDRLLWASVNLRGVTLDSAHAVALAQSVVEAARTTPGVDNAARGVSVPFASSWGAPLSVPGIDSVSKLGDFTLQATTSQFFATVGTRILEGRSFVDGNPSPREMVVTQTMANRLWPNETALGKCIHVRGRDTPCYIVVGVAEDVRRKSLSSPEAHYYLPIDLYQPRAGSFVIRTAGSATDYSGAVRRALQQVMPGSAYVTVTPLQTLLNPQLRSWRLGATMFCVFGLLALLLAAIGLYSAIAYSVTQRVHEMGVRIAVGARPVDVIHLILREAMRVAVPGIAVGAVVAFGVAPLVRPMLFAESPRDPMVFTIVVLTLLVTALSAAVAPAWRAASVDPTVALRSE